MLNKMTKLCVCFVALALMSSYVLSHEDYKYKNEDNTNLKTLSRHKRQFRINLGDILGTLNQASNNNNNQPNKDPLAGLISTGINAVATNPDVQQGLLNAVGINIPINRPNQATTSTQSPVTQGIQCGGNTCLSTEQCCRTCDSNGNPTVPSGCSSRCPQVFCQPNTTPRPNQNGGFNNGQTGGNLQECIERQTEYIGNDLNIANNGIRNKKRRKKDCQRSCQDTPGCNYWVHVSRRNDDRRIRQACYLKQNKISVVSSKKGWSSGPRDCNENSNNGNNNSEDLVACKTTDGGTPGALCVLPFIYKGKKYTGCTLKDSDNGQAWCSVRVDGDGKHIGGQGLWGHCNSKCPTDLNGIDPGPNNTPRPPITVDCQWSSWTPWGSCSKTCGSGQKRATRQIQTPAAGGGRNCEGSSSKTEQCNTGSCPTSSPTCGVNKRQSNGLRKAERFKRQLRFEVDSDFPVAPPPTTDIPSILRIVGGRPADPDEWPWLAALIRPSSKSSGQYCGAALIGDEWVLTAAHCLAPFTKEKIKVTLGEYSFDQDDETLVQEKIGIRNMKNHEKYNDKTFENDIALIRLDRKVQFSKSVYPICLPPKGTDFTDTRAFVVGWGTIYFGGPTSSVLQEVNVRVWDNKQCAKNYGRLNRKVSDNMLCAGDRGKDACQGDSGGPLNCLDFQTGKWELCGVVSWGARCAEPDFPGVYTRVTDYLDWIENTKGQL